MGDHTETALPGNNAASTATASADKGKGKAVDRPDDVEMDEDESSEEEDELEDAVDEDEDAANDNLEPISTDNIISGGRRTRGREVNYAELAAKEREAGDIAMDEDDDEDFKAAPEDDEMEH